MENEEHIVEIEIKRSEITLIDDNKSIYQDQKGIPIPQVISHKDYPKNQKRGLTDVEWENFKKILNSNKENYIKRCIWILSQIRK